MVISPGETQVFTTIDVSNDAGFEGNETFDVSIVSSDPPLMRGLDSVSSTIIDDEGIING